MSKIYTGGSCFPNPNGCGGWSFVVVDDDKVFHQESGKERNTTVNRVELLAILNALKWADKQDDIYSDSQYSINSIVDWYDTWVKKGNTDYKLNVDLISEANKIFKEKEINIYWVKAHRQNAYNELAKELSSEETIKLYNEINGTSLTINSIRGSSFQKKENKKVYAKKHRINVWRNK